MQGSKSDTERLKDVKTTAVCATFVATILAGYNGYLAYCEGNPLRFMVSFLSFLTVGFGYDIIKSVEQELAGTNPSYIENYNDHDL